MANNAKEDLYAQVDRIRKRLGISLYNTTINTLDLCTRKISDLEIIHHTFDTFGFCGAAFVGDRTNTIVLNSTRSEIEQNFDCGHELIHLIRHRRLNNGIFNCCSKNQNSFLEWEANEGAAQLLVPYQDFIPRFAALLQTNTSNIPYILAIHYHVTPYVINIRMDSLAYEIDQYQKGIQLGRIELLSRRQRSQRGIKVPCYSAQCDFTFGLSATTKSGAQLGHW